MYVFNVLLIEMCLNGNQQTSLAFKINCQKNKQT